MNFSKDIYQNVIGRVSQLEVNAKSKASAIKQLKEFIDMNPQIQK